MFNLNKFVMTTLDKMHKSNEDEYRVRMYALTWYQKSVLTDEDMVTIDSWFADEEEPTEEITESEEV